MYMSPNVQTQSLKNLQKSATPSQKLKEILSKSYHKIVQQDHFEQFIDNLSNIQLQQIENQQMRTIDFNANKKQNEEVLPFQNSKPAQRLASIINTAIDKLQNNNSFSQFLQNLQNLQLQAQQVQFFQNQNKKNQAKKIKTEAMQKPTQKIFQIIQATINNVKNQNYFSQFFDNLSCFNEQERPNFQISTKKQSQNENQFIEEDTINYNKLQQAKQYCTNLEVQFTNKLSAFDKTNPIYKNFFQVLDKFFQQKLMLNKKQSFKSIRNSYNFDTISQKNQRLSNKSNKSFRKGENEESFNLQLTLKSRNSKNFMYQSRQDSLVYSNATSFGLQSTSNKPLNFKGRESSSQRQKKSSGTEKQINLANIDRASSKGTIQKDEDIKSLSDNQKPTKLREKANSIKHERKYYKIQNQEQKRLKINTFVDKQEKQEQKNLDIEFEVRKRVNTQNKSSQNAIHIHKKMSHKFIRADNFSEKSVFQSQIQTYQNKIAKIKQAKLLKKKKLEQQLAKINQQIQNLKKQQQIENSPQSDKKGQKNTFQSRLKINNDQSSLKKAQNLVKSLRSQKQNRLKSKVAQQPFDENIHQHMQQIMKQRYMNQEKIKQKKQLQVIQRMKKQQMRKIFQQKQKQANNQFLIKLKKGQNYHQHLKSNGNIEQIQHLKNSKIKGMSSEQNKRTPTKKTQIFQQIQAFKQTPQLTKKKAYLNKIRHFAIIKRPKQDLYQQALN